MAVSSAPAVEISIVLEPDKEYPPTGGHPQIQSADKSAQRKDKPDLPFLEQIKSSNARKLGM